MSTFRFSYGLLIVVAAALGSFGSACGDDETGAGSPSSSATSSGSGGSGGEGGAGGQGGMGGAGGGMGGAGGGSADCDNIPAGPFEPQVFIDVFNGSEDIAFDGKGHIVGKAQQAIVLADAAGVTTPLAMNVPPALGLRYQMDGSLVVALYNEGKVAEVSPQGVLTDLVTGVVAPNGLYPDFDGNVWMTEIGANRVSRINPDDSVDVIVMGAEATEPNGILLDANRKLLFYSTYSEGRIRSVDMSAGGAPAPKEVATVPDSSLDGLVMDACGHLYVVDQKDSELFRVKLDAAGAAVGQPELLAKFPKNVANAQFGSGAGFDSKTLYAAGNPGTVYAVPVGVAGAPVPTPP
ncbi:MAG: gluconolactonase [Polyangiaceae bacterium]|nr:gluconolactonase [Polyangiaceae bacterium]